MGTPEVWQEGGRQPRDCDPAVTTSAAEEVWAHAIWLMFTVSARPPICRRETVLFPAVFTVASTIFVLGVPAVMIAVMMWTARRDQPTPMVDNDPELAPAAPRPLRVVEPAERRLRAVA